MSGRSRTTLKVSAQQEKALETFVFENVEKSENLTKKDKKHCAYMHIRSGPKKSPLDPVTH